MANIEGEGEEVDVSVYLKAVVINDDGTEAEVETGVGFETKAKIFKGPVTIFTVGCPGLGPDGTKHNITNCRLHQTGGGHGTVNCRARIEMDDGEPVGPYVVKCNRV